MTQVRVTAGMQTGRLGAGTYPIPGNSVTVSDNAGGTAQVLGTGIDPTTGKPRATFLVPGQPTELLVDDLLLAYLQADGNLTVDVLG